VIDSYTITVDVTRYCRRLANVSRTWLRWILVLLVIALIASAIVAIPAAKAHWLLVGAMLTVAAAVGLIAWYTLDRYVDRPPKDSIRLILDPG
jgi:peptidoglycan/LPS O-acetylase OafA/YrhL